MRSEHWYLQFLKFLQPVIHCVNLDLPGCDLDVARQGHYFAGPLRMDRHEHSHRQINVDDQVTDCY